MHRIVFLMAAAGVLIAPVAQADEALLKKHNCIACHAIDKKVIGPAYKDVAKKYKGQKDVVAKLADKVKKGGQGVWGQVPMPPNPAVPDADNRKMVEFILKL
jgi:cytochrome c